MKLNYSEVKNFEEAFLYFLRKIKIEKKIAIIYYLSQNRKSGFSFIGYETNQRGLHGVHFNKEVSQYQFGTKLFDRPSYLMTLTARQEEQIPDYIKGGFKEVATIKINKIIKKPDK